MSDPVMDEWDRIGRDIDKALAEFDAQHAKTVKAVDGFMEASRQMKHTIRNGQWVQRPYVLTRSAAGLSDEPEEE